ncbi:MAG: acetate/propionate family kinase [Nitrospiraceae bacterium]|nr:MAG: acetate/propionate family kinase [Nitrospiraceae bacterium]
MVILTVNTGSSSVRLAAFVIKGSRPDMQARGHFQTGENDPGTLLRAFLDDNNIKDVSAVAHRVVHGGVNLVNPCVIDSGVESEIRRLSSLAPLHNPAALNWVRICREFFGGNVPQIAVFDTAFYSGMPAAASTYALPGGLCKKFDIRRYGFHGLAHSAMLRRWQEISPYLQAGGRVISLQLGAGCSITAVKNGQAVDTSMGFSPLEGLVMATRSGDIDPGVVTYLIHSAGFTPFELEKLLNNHSGLLGVSDLSSDMRVLLESESPEARLAVDLYCYRIRKYTGAYIAVLGGVDAVLFGGGVGENAPFIRNMILADMQWCGIELDGRANSDTIEREGCISMSSGRVGVWVIPVDEAAVLEREAEKFIKGAGGIHE